MYSNKKQKKNYITVMQTITVGPACSKGIKVLRVNNCKIVPFAIDIRSRDRMVVGFTTTYAISAYHH